MKAYTNKYDYINPFDYPYRNDEIGEFFKLNKGCDLINVAHDFEVKFNRKLTSHILSQFGYGNGID